MASKSMPLAQIANEFEKFISSQLDTYEKELNVNIDKTLKEVAHEFKDDLYKVTPVGPGKGPNGHLRDNLNVKAKKGKNHVAQEVNFGNKGWLSTILEFGWKTSSGKLIKNPFVRPTFELNKDKYFNKIKESVERGGDK